MIWRDNITRQYYLIPESTMLVSGSLKLTTTTGKSRFVDPVNVKPFEISEEKASEWLLQQTGDVLKRLKSSVSATFEEKLRSLREKVEAEISSQPVQVEEWKDFFEKLAQKYGQQSENLTSAATRGTQTLFNNLFDVITDAISPDQQHQQQSKNKAASLEDLLQQLDIPIDGQISKLSEKLITLSGKHYSQDQATKLANRLEQLAAKIKSQAGRNAD